MTTIREAAEERFPAVNGTEWAVKLSKSHQSAFIAGAALMREQAAQVAESSQFWGDDPLSSDEIAYNVARREAAAAIREIGEEE